MRIGMLIALVALAGCATAGAPAETSAPGTVTFVVDRGSAPPPPAEANARQAQAPPEGQAAGGLDFGQWRQADPAQYAPAFQRQIRARLAGMSQEQVQADLLANGFACESGARLDCRIEIMERECGIDWYVVMERGRPEPVAGFDVMCLGAR